MPLDLLALDRTSARFYTEDGHLKVAVSHISKANICGYRGKEIPGAEQLGLDPDRVYQLFRHPDELARAVGSFNSLPLLSKHQPVTAMDHPNDLVVGSTGTDAVFRNPYLDNSLVIWNAEAIAAVESGEQRQISCGYRYDVVMQPGVWQGAPYDGVMTNIRGNHVALVANGRAGADVVVMDSKESTLMSRTRSAPSSRRVAVARGALMAHLRARLAQDERVDLGSVLAGVTAANIDQRRTVIIERLRAATEGKFREGMALDAENIGELLESSGLEDPSPSEMGAAGGHQGMPENEDPEDTNAGVAADDDIAAQVMAMFADKLDPEDLQALLQLIQPPAAPSEEMSKAHEMASGEAEAPGALPPSAPEPAKPTAPAAAPKPVAVAHAEAPPAKPAAAPFPPKKADDAFAPGTQAPAFQPAHDRGGRMGPKGPPGVDRAAMDSAISRARRETEAAVVSRMIAIREAEKAVRPWVGELAIAMDSADAVYRYALDTLGVDVEGIHVSALPKILTMQPKPGDAPPRAPRMAQDSKAIAGYYDRYPGAKRARVIG